jgi:hypothetical protein
LIRRALKRRLATRDDFGMRTLLLHAQGFGEPRIVDAGGVRRIGRARIKQAFYEAAEH